MNRIKLGIGFVVLASSGFAQMTQGRCLRTLHKLLADDKITCHAGVDILFSGKDRDRNNLLSVCDAFYDQPALFEKNVKQLIQSRDARQVFGKPLHNGTIYKTLPGTRNWWYHAPTGPIQGSIGDFVDVDHDGDLDYVVAVYFDSDSFDLGISYYYRATFINVGNGWTMNHCESNMQGDTFNRFPFLIVPCPNL